MAVRVTSTAFTEGQTIPEKHTCDGQDISPPLSWTGVPQNARSLALICDDPDAPAGTWVHWVLYGLQSSAAGLEEGIPKNEALSNGASQGRNDFKRIGYGGPCPPRGAAHRYFFKLNALDREIPLEPGATKQELLAAMEGHVVAQGVLMGRYQRK
jgi:Raf kinase inhibitor-like YbhB/YbcL family protein